MKKLDGHVTRAVKQRLQDMRQGKENIPVSPFKKVGLMNADIHSERRHHLGHRSIHDQGATSCRENRATSLCNLLCIRAPTTHGMSPANVPIA